MITQLIDVSNISAPWTSSPISTNISGPRATLYVMNVSNQTYFLDFGDGNVAHLPPYWARPFCLPSSIKWVTISIAKSPIGMPNPPFSHIAIETYLLGEDTSNLMNTPINAQVSVQGSTNVSLTTSQAIKQDAQPANTSLIEVTPVDAGASTWLADNEGNLTIKSNNAGVLSNLLQLIAGAGAIVKTGSTGITTEAVGDLKVDGTTFTAAVQVFGTLTLASGSPGIVGGAQMKLGQAASADILDAGGTTTYLKGTNAVAIQTPNGTSVLTFVNDGASGGSIRATNGHLKLSTSTTDGDVMDAVPAGTTFLKGATGISLQVPNGSTQASLASSGVFTAVGFNLSGTNGNTYAMYTNGLSRISQFSGTGSVTTNHNLGAIPSFAIAGCSAAGGSQTMGCTQGTSTQCTVVAGNSLAWTGLAVRF